MKLNLAAWLFAIAPLAAYVAQATYAASPRCDDERESAGHTARKILDEWPIRERDFITDYVDRVARRIIKESRLENEPWRIIIVRNLSANGFSVGDGYLFVNEGALLHAETESQLAAVIAHEIAHQVLGHFCPASGNSSISDWSLFSGDKGRKDTGKSKKLGSIHQVIDPLKELEADRRALDLLSLAGYDPTAMLQLARRATPRNDGPDSFGDRRVVELERILTQAPKLRGTDSKEFLWIREQLNSTVSDL